MIRAPGESVIREEIYRIQMQCQESNMAWCDPEFEADDKALYIDALNPPEYA